MKTLKIRIVVQECFPIKLFMKTCHGNMPKNSPTIIFSILIYLKNKTDAGRGKNFHNNFSHYLLRNK